MKKIIIPLLLLCMCLCACGKKELEPWTMPEVDAAPTVAPTQGPSYTGAASPEVYRWNEATVFDMADPGVEGEFPEQELSHSESLKLFSSQILPEKIFTESYSQYSQRKLQKSRHDVLLDENAQLCSNAYVEFLYLPSSGDVSRGISVMAELVDHEKILEIYNHRQYPHASYAEDMTAQISVYYLEDFMLLKVGETRYAQTLVLPKNYFSSVSALENALEAEEELSLPRQVLLNFSCGEKVSDEEFIAAVCQIWQYGSGIDPAPEEDKLPKPGEKGAA